MKRTQLDQGPAQANVADAPNPQAAAQTAAATIRPTVAKPVDAPLKSVPALPVGALALVSPVIRLTEYLHFKGEMTRELKPSRAYLYQGAIVIEEMGLILPLANNYIRTGDK